MKINDAMKKLVMQIDLSEDEVREVMEEIMRGKLHPVRRVDS